MKGIARAYEHVTLEMREQILHSLEQRWHDGLAGLTPDELAQLVSWFPHLRTALNRDQTDCSRSTHRLHMILDNTEIPSSLNARKGL